MTHYQNIHPAFLVEDLEQAVRFYVDVLGFEKKWAWPGREGEPDIRIGVGPSVEQGGEAFEINLIDNPEAGPSGTSFVNFQMTGVDEIYARCLRHNANIYLELGDRDWGMKDFHVTDPFGNKLGFGEVL